MTVSELMANKLNLVLEKEYVGELVTLTPKTGDPVTGQGSFELIGDSSSDWSGGDASVAIVCLQKSDFASRPLNHETITRADSTVWTIDSLIGEDPISWTVKVFREFRPR